MHLCNHPQRSLPEGLTVTRTRSEESGATAVEYALFVALIAIVIVGSAAAFGVAVTDLFVVPWP